MALIVSAIVSACTSSYEEDRRFAEKRAGLPGTPEYIARASPDELARLDDWDLIVAFHVGPGRGPARQELERRNVFSSHEWHMIEIEELEIGMRELAAVAARGEWEEYAPFMMLGTINTTTTALGVHRQYAIRGHRRHCYIYTDNGVVTAFEE